MIFGCFNRNTGSFLLLNYEGVKRLLWQNSVNIFDAPKYEKLEAGEFTNVGNFSITRLKGYATRGQLEERY
jgi:hypothetical protein